MDNVVQIVALLPLQSNRSTLGVHVLTSRQSLRKEEDDDCILFVSSLLLDDVLPFYPSISQDNVQGA